MTRPWVVLVPEGINPEDPIVQSILLSLPGSAGVLVVPPGVEFIWPQQAQEDRYAAGWRDAVTALRDRKAFSRWQQKLSGDDQYVWPSPSSREHLALYLEAEADRHVL